MKLSTVRYLDLKIVIALLIIASIGKGANFDLAVVPTSQIRTYLRPRLALAATENCVPLTIQHLAGSQGFGGGLRWGLWGAPQWKTGGPGFPSVWLALTPGKNLTIGGGLTAAFQDGENLNGMQAFASYAWGAATPTNNLTCANIHVKGPDDFHYRDLLLTYSRNWERKPWRLALSYTVHLLQCRIHIRDRAYYATKNFNLGQMHIGLQRQLGDIWECGAEIALSRDAFYTGLSLFYFLQ